MAGPDIDTKKAIQLQEQQMANNTALTAANAKAMDQQAQNEFRKSMAELGAKVEDNPQDDASKVALAIAMLFGGDPGWKQWIDNVLATSIDTDVRQAAHGVLGYLGRLSHAH